MTRLVIPVGSLVAYDESSYKFLIGGLELGPSSLCVKLAAACVQHEWTERHRESEYRVEHEEYRPYTEGVIQLESAGQAAGWADLAAGRLSMENVEIVTEAKTK